MTHAPNPSLRDHVTGVKFNLSLGASHVQVLAAVATRTTARIPYHVWMAAVAGLERRGLLTRAAAAKVVPNWEGSYELTRAGWLTAHLLAEAGLCDPIPEHDNARNALYA